MDWRNLFRLTRNRRRISRRASVSLETLEGRIVPATVLPLTGGSGFAVNGSAQLVDDALRLTNDEHQAASVLFSETVGLENFTAQFEFEISQAIGIGWGDGFAFVVLDGEIEDEASIGNSGGELGYGGLSGFAIEFDTYQNAEFNDPPDVHIGLNVGGSTQSLESNGLPFDIRGAGKIYANIEYVDGVIAVSLQQPDADAIEVLKEVVPEENRPILGRVGFTGGTGSAAQVSVIDNFELTQDGGSVIRQTFDIGNTAFSYQMDSVQINLPGDFEVRTAGTMGWYLKEEFGFFADPKGYYHDIYLQGESWVRGEKHEFGNNWYWIKPTGEFGAWNGVNGEVAGKSLGFTDPVYNRVPGALANAQPGKHMAQLIQEELGLYYTDNDYRTWAKTEALWLVGKENDFGQYWYYLTPTGHFYEWNGTDHGARGKLIYKFDRGLYVDYAKLHSPQSHGMTAEFNKSEKTITVDPTPGFVGDVVIELKNVSTGKTNYFTVSAVDHVPVAPALAPVSMTDGEGALDVDLPLKDADQELVDYTAQVGTIGDYLKRRYVLEYGKDPKWHQGYAGTTDRWIKGPGASWFFIRENGEFYRWDGVLNSATGQILHVVDSKYYDNPRLLYEDQTAGLPNALVSTAGNILTITQPEEYLGTFPVTLVASENDKQSFTLKEITVTVEPLNPVFSVITEPGFSEGNLFEAKVKDGLRNKEVSITIIGENGQVEYDFGKFHTDSNGQLTAQLEMPYILPKSPTQVVREIEIAHGGLTERIPVEIMHGPPIISIESGDSGVLNPGESYIIKGVGFRDDVANGNPIDLVLIQGDSITLLAIAEAYEPTGFLGISFVMPTGVPGGSTIAAVQGTTLLASTNITVLHDAEIVRELFIDVFGRNPGPVNMSYWQSRTDKVGPELVGAMEFAKQEYEASALKMTFFMYDAHGNVIWTPSNIAENDTMHARFTNAAPGEAASIHLIFKGIVVQSMEVVVPENGTVDIAIGVPSRLLPEVFEGPVDPDEIDVLLVHKNEAIKKTIVLREGPRLLIKSAEVTEGERMYFAIRGVTADEVVKITVRYDWGSGSQEETWPIGRTDGSNQLDPDKAWLNAPSWIRGEAREDAIEVEIIVGEHKRGYRVLLKKGPSRDDIIADLIRTSGNGNIERELAVLLTEEERILADRLLGDDWEGNAEAIGDSLNEIMSQGGGYGYDLLDGLVRDGASQVLLSTLLSMLGIDNEQYGVFNSLFGTLSEAYRMAHHDDAEYAKLIQIGVNPVGAPIHKNTDRKNHLGDDYVIGPGVPIISPVSGDIADIGSHYGYGTMSVTVKMNLKSAQRFVLRSGGQSDPISTVWITFGHLRPSKDQVASNDRFVRFRDGMHELEYATQVKAGQRLGYIEDFGPGDEPYFGVGSSGPHLHITMTFVNDINYWLAGDSPNFDPARFLKPNAAWETLIAAMKR